ncbi:MAG: hypothetical protein AB8G23_05910 [Myxococcota bacterium]
MDIALIIQLISGAVGGNVAGGLLKEGSLGPIGNSIAGILGGGIGGTVLASLGLGGGGEADIAGILSSVAGGGVGGGGLLAIVGLVKSALAKG